MVGFTQELSCTDRSTDAYIFLPSVHSTLYKSVGPTCHNDSARLAFHSNPNYPVRRRPSLSHRTLPSSRLRPSLAYAHVPRPLHRPYVLVAGRPRHSSTRFSRARAAVAYLGFGPPRNFQPSAVSGARRRSIGAAHSTHLPP
jgi:hypothetical protein